MIPIEKLELCSPNNINMHWPPIKNTLHSAGLVGCDLTRRVLTLKFYRLVILLKQASSAQVLAAIAKFDGLIMH